LPITSKVRGLSYFAGSCLAVWLYTMPIYAYKCSVCGHAKDVLQKISDDPLSVCPACGAAAFAKQVTAAGFQLKGSGWYVSDFRQGGDGANSGVGKPAESSTEPASSITPAPSVAAAPAPSAPPAVASAPAAAPKTVATSAGST
jgi:putative FmdB family regulatory protein